MIRRLGQRGLEFVRLSTPKRGVDWDERTRTKEIFFIHGQRRKNWSKHVANELGNYDYLLGADVRMHFTYRIPLHLTW